MRTLNLQRRHAGKPGAIERAAEALQRRGAPKPLLTPIELTVLCRVARDEDPWSGVSLHEVTGNGGIRGGSRIVSQALGRLRRKGMLEEQTPYRLTVAGWDRYKKVAINPGIQAFRVE